MGKKTATVDDVKAAYTQSEADAREVLARRRRPRPLGVIEFAEAIAGKAFYTNTLTGRTRASLAREAVDFAELNRSIKELVDTGWLRQVSYDEAQELQLSSYGLTRKGRYYLSAEDYAAAVAAKDRADLTSLRERLRQSAFTTVCLRHTAEVDAEYERLCAEHGIEPQEAS
jgi:hypothetical protein